MQHKNKQVLTYGKFNGGIKGEQSLTYQTIHYRINVILMFLISWFNHRLV